jgi:hypothetical protein
MQLLERYPDVVSIMRRPGEDFLVAPAGKSDLLAKGIQGRFFSVRNDLFQAFTTVADARPYYDRSADAVVWQRPGDEPKLPESFVAMEPATGEAETQLRRDFAENHATPAARPQLLAALTRPQPFSGFSRAVRDAGLQRAWHGFRTNRLVEKLQNWATAHQIEWKNAWLTEGWADRAAKNPAIPVGGAVARSEEDPLRVLISGLDAVDMQRISIPLDLVLKAISSSKKR